MNKFFYLITTILVIISCQNKNAGSSEAPEDSIQDVIASNAAEHELSAYWNDFNFDNTELIKSPQIGERKFVDFLAALPSVADSVAMEAIRAHLRLAELNRDGFNYYIKQYEHYLYDPNSPMRNDLYFQSVLEYLIESANVDQTSKARYRINLKLVSQNKVGEKAIDFTFVDAKGRSRTLETETSEYKILFFYDPTCSTCAGEIHDLEHSKATNDLIAQGRLKVVAVSLHPEKELWLADQSSIPNNWVNGFDSKGMVIGKGLYNILAYPTIYLLDCDNKVLVKDAPLDVTLRHLFKLAGEN